jgi:hypothetical protein
VKVHVDISRMQLQVELGDRPTKAKKPIAEMASGATPVTGIALTRASTTWLYTIGVLTTVGWIVFARIW